MDSYDGVTRGQRCRRFIAIDVSSAQTCDLVAVVLYQVS
jgi:hypothetical protein